MLRIIAYITGLEGPRQDKYFFEEWRVARNNNLIVGHFGLREDVAVNGKTIAVNENAQAVFEDLIGLDGKHLEKAYARIHYVCSCGERKNFRIEHTYPETIVHICNNCNQIVFETCNITAIR